MPTKHHAITHALNTSPADFVTQFRQAQSLPLSVAHPQPMEDAMSHYLNEKGQFQSDQSLYLAPDEIVLSLRAPAAMEALYVYAELTDDDDLAPALTQVPKEPPADFWRLFGCGGRIPCLFRFCSS